MKFEDLRQLLSFLEKEGELAIVEEEVDPFLEIATIHRKVIAAQGPALLFTKVKGSHMPVVSNLFGTPRRVEMAFESKEIISSLARIINHFDISIRDLKLLKNILNIGTRYISKAPVNEIVSTAVDLTSYPATVSWEMDGGPFFTLPLVFTKDPISGVPNLGIYRMQIFSKKETGMHWQIGKGGGFHFYNSEILNRPLKVSVAFGGPPILTLAAILPLPEGISELLFASLLLGKKIALLKNNDSLIIPATAEFVLTGYVPNGIRKEEGPFGDHYGYYSLKHPFPVFKVKKLYSRRDAILPVTVVGKPKQEDFFIGEYLQELLEPIIKLAMPGICKLWSYGEAGFHTVAGAVVKCRHSREALTHAFRILGEGQLSFTKFLFVTDDETVNPRNFKEFLTHILKHSKPEKDLYTLANLPLDTLDYSSSKLNLGSKGIWVALEKEEKQLPQEFFGNVQHIKEAKVFCPGCLVVSTSSYSSAPTIGKKIASDPSVSNWPLIVIVDAVSQAVSSTLKFLWYTFTLFDPARDIYSKEEKIVYGQVSRTPPIVFDCRYKPFYPPILNEHKETEKMVSKKWYKYFTNKKVEMGETW